MSAHPRTTPRRRRWVTIVLTISLALNLLVASAIGARVIFGHGGFYGRQYGSGGAMVAAGRHLLWSLPRERRNELRAIVRLHKPQFRAMRSEHDEARRALADAITAEPFDIDRFDQAFTAMTQNESKAHEQIRALGRTFILKLTPEERATFAADLRKPRRWRRH